MKACRYVCLKAIEEKQKDVLKTRREFDYQMITKQLC